MQWVRRATLIISFGFGLLVIALVLHSFWLGSQNDPALLGNRVLDLQVLAIILLAWAGFYTVVFLLWPIISDKIHQQNQEDLARLVRTHLPESIHRIPDLEEHIRQVTSGRSIELTAASRLALEVPQLLAPGEGIMTGRDYVQLSGALKTLNKGMVQVYQALAALCPPEDHVVASSYLKQAIDLCADPTAAAEINYSQACLLARHGKLDEALVELRRAFTNKSPELERRLVKDTEEGGPLNELATREPYDRDVDDLLLAMTIGKSASRDSVERLTFEHSSEGRSVPASL